MPLNSYCFLPNGQRTYGYATEALAKVALEREKQETPGKFGRYAPVFCRKCGKGHVLPPRLRKQI